MVHKVRGVKKVSQEYLLLALKVIKVNQVHLEHNKLHL